MSISDEARHKAAVQLISLIDAASPDDGGVTLIADALPVIDAITDHIFTLALERLQNSKPQP